MKTVKTVKTPDSIVVLTDDNATGYVEAMSKSTIVVNSLEAMRKLIGSKGTRKVNLYPFRKKIEIDEDIYNQDAELERNYSHEKYRGCNKLKDYILINSNPSENKNGNLFDKRLDEYKGLSLQGIIDKAFEDKGGSITLRDVKGTWCTITKELFMDFLKMHQTRGRVRKFDKIRKELKTENYVPICKKTLPYIRFNKGYSLVTFKLGSAEEVGKYISDNIAKGMTDYAFQHENEDVEIVDFSYTNHFTHLRVLCKSEGVDELLRIFADVYRKEKVSFVEAHHAYITVIDNIGQEDEKSEWYQLFTGDVFNVIKESLLYEKQEDLFYGFPVYK
ncbi:hypothetical protein [Bacillus toyonensis]|uniref:hypothetical protein n=1 Tax=Bacillus toyonensis TaxID=155322 RepID=UPI000BF93F40|nr:hypothetical protein [Bacillus toyonensis]PGF05219.1 hypothetical protein COM61_02020 [Bacillus toyonensis]